MACSKSSGMVVTSLLLLLLLGGSGCEGNVRRLPPPSPADPTGVGGGGGAGGDGGGGTDTPPNVCECAYSAIVSVECGNCVNKAAFDQCVTEGQTCADDDQCAAIAGCPAKCNDVAEDKKAACTQTCVLDAKDSESFPLYAALMECVCAPCTDHCAPDEPIACQ